MGNLILTSSPKAVHPYYATLIGIHLYTAEELSYYIYNNLMLLDESFVDERLLDFLGRELDMPDTVRKLNEWKDTSDFGELLLVILQDCNYYSSAELQKFKEELVRFKEEGMEALLLEKADYLSEIGKLYDAVGIYNKLINLRTGIMTSQAKKARVYAHLSAAEARLFNYEEAFALCRTAYELDPRPEYLRQLFFISKTAPSVKDDGAFDDVLPDTVTKWNSEYEEAVEAVDNTEQVKELEQLLARDEIKKQAGLTKMAVEWKNEYRRSEG